VGRVAEQVTPGA